MIKINVQMEVALIAASAAILGSLVPQLFTHFSKKETYKDELRREYKLNKVKTYQLLSEMIINMWVDDVKMDGREWTGKYITEFEKYKISYGIWLEDDEMDMINEIQGKFLDMSNREFLDTEYDGSVESLSEKVTRLQNLCRRRLKEEYYIISK